MKEIMRISRKYNLKVIEDCACAIGTKYGNKYVGSFGEISCFSFHPRKIITTGEGGAICTQNLKLFNKIKAFKNHGGSGPDKKEKIGPWTMARITEFGFNYRFNDILAAIGVEQMKKIKFIIRERKKLAAKYSENLKDLNLINVPEKIKNFDQGHTFQSYVVRIKTIKKEKRNKIMLYLLDKKIETRPGTYSLPNLECYKKDIDNVNSFKNSKLAFDTTITLPLYPDMGLNTIDYICEKLKIACRKYL